MLYYTQKVKKKKSDLTVYYGLSVKQTTLSAAGTQYTQKRVGFENKTKLRRCQCQSHNGNSPEQQALVKLIG